MPKGLRRRHGGERHFITCSCYHRLPWLGSARRRDVFLNILEEVRGQFDFVVWGYVVMPEHFHLLITEPRIKTLSLAMQVLKQRVSRRCRRRRRKASHMALWDSPPLRAFWQPRYYDFNVFRERKHMEKLRYMHPNPVKREGKPGTGSCEEIEKTKIWGVQLVEIMWSERALC